MAQLPITQDNYYKAVVHQFNGDTDDGNPNWLQTLRKNAFAKFEELGFPTARRGNEEWKYTDVRPIARSVFSRPIISPNKPTNSELQKFTFGEESWAQLVFVNGTLAPEISSQTNLPNGVIITDLAEAALSHTEIVQANLGRHMQYESNAFSALNTAFINHGAFVYIPKGVVVSEPLHLIFVTTQRQQTASHPRVLIVTGEDSSSNIIQSYVGLDDIGHLSNVVTETVVGKGSSLRHYTVQQQSEQDYHISNTQVVVNGNSFFSSINFDFGGGLVRNNLNVLMAEEGGSCLLNGLYMPTGTQHVDNQVTVDHAKGHTNAFELYKGILNGKARSVFHGSIIVQKDAAKVNASQSDKNLLLSPEAEADTKPAFWIYCDDVKCAHGAACGQIDDNQMFYLRTRGLSEADAKRLLVGGFATEVVDSVQLTSLRNHVSELVDQRLGGWLGEEQQP